MFAGCDGVRFAQRTTRLLRRAYGVAPSGAAWFVRGCGPRGEPHGSYGCPSATVAPYFANPPTARRNPIILTCRAPSRAVFDAFFAGCLTPRRVSRARSDRPCFVVPRSENRRNGNDLRNAGDPNMRQVTVLVLRDRLNSKPDRSLTEPAGLIRDASSGVRARHERGIRPKSQRWTP